MLAHMDHCVLRVKRGCYKLHLPSGTAKELIRFLIVKRLAADAMYSKFLPSEKLDSLLRWTLLNTDVLHLVESLTGKIYYAQDIDLLSAEDKLSRR